MTGCSSCDAVSTDPTLTALVNGGGKKKKGAKNGTKNGARKHGGSFLGDLGQLAIPLGLIAAKEGVEYMRKKKPSSSKSKSKSVARRASFGGSSEGSAYPSAVSTEGIASAPVNFALEPLSPSPSPSPASQPSQLEAPAQHIGGAARSAAIAREFRKMASEISEFLQKRKAKAASKPKKPKNPKVKKGGADCEAKKKKKGGEKKC